MRELHLCCGRTQAQACQCCPPWRLGKEFMRQVAEVHAEVDAIVHGDAVQSDVADRIFKGVHMVEAEEGVALQSHLLQRTCMWHAIAHKPTRSVWLLW